MRLRPSCCGIPDSLLFPALLLWGVLLCPEAGACDELNCVSSRRKHHGLKP